MNDNGSDIVGMGLEGCDLFRGVVVVDTELEVVGAANNPVLARDKATGTDGKIGEFERLNSALGLVGPDVRVSWRNQLVGMATGGKGRTICHRHTIVECSENPGLVRMKINALDSLTASIKLALYMKRAVSCFVLRTWKLEGTHCATKARTLAPSARLVKTIAGAEETLRISGKSLTLTSSFILGYWVPLAAALLEVERCRRRRGKAAWRIP